MGCFDSFYLNCKCPHCGNEAVVEFQTKQFSSIMDCWNEGDAFETRAVKVFVGTIYDVYGGCNSEKCTAWEKKKLGYTSGFGRGMKCDVLIEGGVVEEAINVRKD